MKKEKVKSKKEKVKSKKEKVKSKKEKVKGESKKEKGKGEKPVVHYVIKINSIYKQRSLWRNREGWKWYIKNYNRDSWF